jgi:formylglycine-generating enzyme required for sulfatase activity
MIRLIQQRLGSQETLRLENQPQWYVNSQGMTMVVIPGPVEFLMGSPASEAGRRPVEAMHSRRVGRAYAIAAKPVTVAQFLRFRAEHDYLLDVAPSNDCPVHSVTWYLGAEYCNLLSKQEGLAEKEWCYEPNADGKFAEGMRMTPDYLRRAGYRFPTEAEWEYACRAGAKTSRYYGDSDELLRKYAWYIENSGNRSWPVGSVKPNDWGLFDMHGNIWTRCQETYQPHRPSAEGESIEDHGDDTAVLDKDFRVVRGGSFAESRPDIRCACRLQTVPAQRIPYLGLRVARTFRSD